MGFAWAFVLILGTFLAFPAQAQDPEVAEETIHMSAPFPNPAQAYTSLTIDASEPTPARIEVFTLLGQRIARPFDAIVSPGDATRVRLGIPASWPPGLYLIRLTTAESTQTHRLTVTR